MSNDTIIYKDIQGPLGMMIAGATSKGVCFLEWHDRGGIDRIKQRVWKRYRMPLEPGSREHLDKLEQEIDQYFKGKLKIFTVHIDVKGSRFEMATWEQLLKIPYGQTSTYSQVARQLNRPGAVRAVGRANGANYLAIVIPCHRVIRADRGLCGYGGKIWRKKWLLELEQG